MKTVTVHVEKRYVWKCPNCGETCEECADILFDKEFIECDYCGEYSFCDAIVED